ncbi:MAG: MarR family winged helix-turn-helix transcriptional regulator [Beijerinckiaceae bacterium]
MSDGLKDAEHDQASQEDLAALDLTALHATTGFIIRIVQLQIFQSFFETFSARGLTTGGFSALVAIRDNPGIQQGVLADCMLIKRSNMTKLINSLEARDLVERRVSASDKRAIDLYLTPRGRTVLAQLSDDVAQHDLDVTRALSPVEKERLLDYLNRISQDLRARRKFES